MEHGNYFGTRGVMKVWFLHLHQKRNSGQAKLCFSIFFTERTNEKTLNDSAFGSEFKLYG